MELKFSSLVFEIEENKIFIKEFGCVKQNDKYPFVDVHIAGENRIHEMGTKIICGSEFYKFNYVSHVIKDNILEIVQKSNLIEVTTYFEKYDNTNAIRVSNKIRNISNRELVIEEFSILNLFGLGKNGVDSTRDLYLTKILSSHHAECQPRTNSFNELGLFRGNLNGQKTISGKNVGSWSTKEMIPMGIVEDKDDDSFFAFEIESNNSWYYEFADIEEKLYLSLSTCSLVNLSWYKKLETNEEYKSDYASICLGKTFNDVIFNLTSYRRNIAYKAISDIDMPIIYNEYMHFSWDDPNETRTLEMAKFIKDLGVEYYVIDCGWHDEVDSKDIYANLGTWKESKRRFPNGLKNTIDYLHSIGLKAGLWLEPEMLGINNTKMLDYYNHNEGLLTRFNLPIISRNRYFLDFKNERVINYLNDTMKYLIEDLGVDYIKLDYNEDLGVGVDKYNTSLAEGLKNQADAYLNWINNIKDKYPNCLFETCSSGGMRMDYKTLSNFSICSTSDQVFYDRYPYIVSNVLACVLAFQAAVWSYPVASPLGYDVDFKPTKEWVSKNISRKQVVMNMVNALNGRIHLASNLTLLDDSKIELVKQGLELYNNLKDIKKKSFPYFPNGLSKFYDKSCVAGFKNNEEIYLSVWALKEKVVSFSVDEDIENIEFLYPSSVDGKILYKNKDVNVLFNEMNEACFIKISLKRK